MQMLRTIIIILFVANLAACQYFGVNFTQGNLVSATQMRKLHTGMTEQEVTDLLGSPLYENTFRTDRWVYVFTRQERDVMTKKKVILTFKNGRLARIQR